MTTEQGRIWDEEKRAVQRLVDGLGRPVDQAIVETVTILRLLGLHTYSSCGGHADRALSPYVAFRSPDSNALRRRLEEAADQPTAERLRGRALQANARELQRLLPYLDRFYANRPVPQSGRVSVQGFGLVGYRVSVQSADLLHVISVDQRSALLDEHRQELGAFTDFLKAEFFGTKNEAPSSAVVSPPKRA